MKVACVGYRSWAIKIYLRLAEVFDQYEFLMQLDADRFCEDEIKEFCPDFILFYGWSKIIPSSIIESYRCLMLHPSALPKFRGGSPIQNQIVQGEIDSAVSIFLMDNGIDTGPIARQEYLSLDGTLDEIFSHIESLGFKLTQDIFDNGLKEFQQNDGDATYFKRRSPEQSEITITELETRSAKYLNNKIRMLQDPYPNPFIRTVDGKRLIIKSCEISDE